MRRECMSVNKGLVGRAYTVELLAYIRSMDHIRESLLIPPDMILYLERRKALLRLHRRVNLATAHKPYGAARRMVCIPRLCRITHKPSGDTWLFLRCHDRVLTARLTPLLPVSRIHKLSSRRVRLVPLPRIPSLAAGSISTSAAEVMAGVEGRRANE